MTHFGNPVSKNKERIRRKSFHYTWYRLAGSREVTRHVEIANQFGKDRLILGDPEILLAPALKYKRPPRRKPVPPAIDHYKGYRILSFDSFKPRTVVLRDQFDKRPVRQLICYPEYLCVPVEKTVGRRTYPIVNAREHLMIYRIACRQYVENRVAVDQFSITHMDDFRADYLAVPTRKQWLKRVPKEPVCNP